LFKKKIEFYLHLYTSRVSAGPSEIQAFFDPLVIPKISPEDQSRMDSKILSEEITQAINSMQNGKTPGPDGLPVEFYKTFSAKLSPFLCKLFEEILVIKKLPHTMTQATITVIPKKGKDTFEFGSYQFLIIKFLRKY